MDTASEVRSRDAAETLLLKDSARELLLAYVDAVDGGRTGDALAVFSPDVVLRGPDLREYVGHDAVAGFFADCGASMTRHLPGSRLRHHLSSIRVGVHAGTDTASAVAYFLAITAAGPDHWGRYRDELVHDGEGWHIAHRKLDIEGWAEDGWYGRHLRAVPADGARS